MLSLSSSPFDPTRTSAGPLFDHLVGALQQQQRHFKAKRFGGFEVDHQLVLGRCLHRKFTRAPTQLRKPLREVGESASCLGIVFIERILPKLASAEGSVPALPLRNRPSLGFVW
jgi:hypothetical protein